jgi:formamidopyrimidine-DNA glycosylase
MPELPEVETMVRGLRPALVGNTIRSIEVRDAFLLQGCTKEELERLGAGVEVSAVGRRGKWVTITLGRDAGIIVIQPRMTGGFWLIPPDRPEHARLIFHVAGSPGTIWFCDTRRLGKIAWHASENDAHAAFARSHGPDALEIEEGDLHARLTRTGRGIKATLLDQKVVAGIGNIYADEILFRSGIHPTRIASSLTKPEVSRIHAAIRPILEEAIAAEGSSFDAGYRTVLGLEGGFLAQNAVHRRKGEPCPSCKEPIVKAYIPGLIGRPTYFCPNCQPTTRGKGKSGSSGRSGQFSVS